jgi:hypothetical protein
VTLALRNPRGRYQSRPSQVHFCGQRGSGRRCSALYRRTARCPLFPRLCPKPGDTLLPIRDFHIWGNLPRHPIERLSHHTSRQSGLLLERWSAFARLRRTTSFEKFIRVLIVSQLLDYMFVDLLIHGYFHTLVTRMFNLAACTSSCQ